MQNKKVPAIIKNSIIIVDKPPGITSHEITTSVKKIVNANRAGHAGTLDPKVSGVLPIALGKATKLLRYIAGKEKTYVGIIRFKKRLSKKNVKNLFSEFTGEIIQTPPRISAVKKVPRKRKIHYLRLLEQKERLVLFETRVDAGTYIRTLCKDIGEKCGGAVMEELRRTAVGSIKENESHKIQNLLDALWLCKQEKNCKELHKMFERPEKFIELPRVHIKQSALESVLSGAQITIPGIESMDNIGPGENVSIYCQNIFIGVGLSKINARDLKKRKYGIAVRIERVHK